ncbi:MAG: hypothetical protein AAF399_29745, partial [Bacteroidota bacterium]
IELLSNMSKLLQLCHSFYPDDWQAADRFFHLLSPPLSGLSLYLWQALYRLGIAEQQHDLETLPQEVFADHADPKRAFREHSHYLFRHLQRFLQWQAFLVHSAYHGPWLLRELRNRGLSHLHQQSTKALHKALNAANLPREIHHHRSYLLMEEANESFGLSQIRRPDQALADKMHHLDHWYLLVKLRESCEMLNRQNLLNSPVQIVLTDELVALLRSDDHPYQASKLLQLWSLTFLLLRSAPPGSDAHFHRLLKELRKEEAQLHPEESRSLYRYLQNYCIKQINAGRVEFMPELLQLYQHLLATELLLEEGRISHSQYKNISTLALRLGESDWAKTFLETYADLVQEPFRENAYQYGLAYHEYTTGKLGAARKRLQQMNFTDVYYEISARHLMLKTLWEEADWETLRYVSTAFAGFLKRNKEVSPANRHNHLNFLKILKRLIRFQERADTWEADKLAAENRSISTLVQELEPLAQRKWLQEQASKLSIS